jgi:8-oxo-dGTP diphosphatase
MSDPFLSFSFDYFDATYSAKSLGKDQMPRFDEVISAHVVPMTDDGKIVAVNVISRGLDVPGGHVEGDEGSPLETLTREIYEEAQITINHPVLIDVLEISSTKSDLGNKKCMLIYAANVSKIETFTPTEEISERCIVTPQEFIDQYFADKTYAKHMLTIAAKTLAGR